MTTEFYTRLRVCTFAVGSVLALTTALTGCNMGVHDTVDTRPPSTMPIPTSAKSAPQTPSTPVPPPPTEAEMGMPIYPNATTYVDSTGNFIKPEYGSGMARLQTPDSVDAVIAFYKPKIMQTNAQGQATPAAPIEEKQDGKRKVVLVGNDAEGNTQMVEAREDEGKTAIELMTTQTKGVPASIGGASKAGDAPGATAPSAVNPPSVSLPASPGAASMPPTSGKLP